jgi:hypothetical protein
MGIGIELDVEATVPITADDDTEGSFDKNIATNKIY